MLRQILLAITFLFALSAVQAEAKTIRIVAAENFYGDIARQIGGAEVEVKSVLNNPGQDPHLFEASPSLARSLVGADLVVLNGIDYDPWMEKLLGASQAGGRRVISAGAVAGRKVGDNPHLWYDLSVVRLVGKAIADKLAEIKPEKAETFKTNAERFSLSLDQLDTQVTEIANQHAGVKVAATEPVFDYMLQAMKLDVQEKEFQLAVMNDTEPSFSDVARFEDDLKKHVIRLLIYNNQVSDPVADKFLKLAKAEGIPVIATSETMPPEHTTYQQWLGHEIAAVAQALRQAR